VTLSDTDRLAILDTITRADDAASRRDADSYVALFTEECSMAPRAPTPAAMRCARRSAPSGPPRARQRCT
jgi:hypothetical protein